MTRYQVRKAVIAFSESSQKCTCKRGPIYARDCLPCWATFIWKLMRMRMRKVRASK